MKGFQRDLERIVHEDLGQLSAPPAPGEDNLSALHDGTLPADWRRDIADLRRAATVSSATLIFDSDDLVERSLLERRFEARQADYLADSLHNEVLKQERTQQEMDSQQTKLNIQRCKLVNETCSAEARLASRVRFEHQQMQEHLATRDETLGAHLSTQRLASEQIVNDRWGPGHRHLAEQEAALMHERLQFEEVHRCATNRSVQEEEAHRAHRKAQATGSRAAASRAAVGHAEAEEADEERLGDGLPSREGCAAKTRRGRARA